MVKGREMSRTGGANEGRGWSGLWGRVYERMRRGESRSGWKRSLVEWSDAEERGRRRARGNGTCTSERRVVGNNRICRTH